MTLLSEAVELQQGRRSRGGVLESAEALPAGWENGIAFRTIGCVEPEILGPCEIADTTEARPDEATFTPVFIRQSAACALMSQVGTVNMAENRLEGTTEWALGRSLATGVLSSNPSFVDASSVHASASADIISAVSCLEQAIADFAFGTDAVLHAPLRAAAYLRANYLIDDFLYSPAGFRWILSSGYPVDAPEGSDQTINLWATGPVWAAVSEAYPLLDGVTNKHPVHWRTNLDAAYAQRLGLAAFDPCLNLTASFVVPACNGES